MTAARFALAVLLAEAAGLALLSRLGRERRSGPGMLGLGFFVGAVSWALWTHLLLWVRIPVTPLSVAAGPVLIAACGRWGALRQLAWNRPPWPAWLMLPAAAVLLYGATSWPLLGVDGDTREMLKARSVSHYGTFWNPDFTDPESINQGRRRPLLGTSMFVNVGHVCGELGGVPLRVWMSLLQIAMWPALYDLLRRRTGRVYAALGAALWAWVPALWHDAGGALTAYLDVPLSMLFLLAVASELPIAVLCMAAAVLLKDDAAPFVLAFAVSRGWKPALLPAAVAGAWIVTSTFLPLDADYFPNGFLHPKWALAPFMVRKTLSEMLVVGHWSFLWVLSWIALAWRSRRFTREDLRWLGPVVIQLGAYFAVWMTLPFPDDLVRFYVKVQVMRLILHVTPIVWFWAVWRSTEGLTPEAPAPSAQPAPA